MDARSPVVQGQAKRKAGSGHSAVSQEESRDSKAQKKQQLILVSYFYYVYHDGVLSEIEFCGFLSDIKSIPSVLSLLKSLLGYVLFALPKFLSPQKKPDEEFSQLISKRKINISIQAQNWGRGERGAGERYYITEVGREGGREGEWGIRIFVTQDPRGFNKASSMLWSIKQYQVRMAHDQEGNCQCSSDTSSLPV